MPDDNQNENLKSAAREELRWHFAFVVIFSVFLVVTFVYYLPFRFREQAEQHGREDMMDEMTGGMEKRREEMMSGGGMTTDMMIGDEHEETISGEHEHESADMAGEHAAHENLYHEEGGVKEGLVTNFNFSPPVPKIGEPVKLEFFVNEKPGNKPVTDLEIEHEKFIHVIGVRDDLNEFFHIHPQEVSGHPGFWSVLKTFEKPGSYKVWSDVARGGATHSFGHPQFNVQGDGPTIEKKIEFLTNVIVGDYQVKLNTGFGLFAEKESDLVFEIRNVIGDPVRVEPYLGAVMHLAAIKDDLNQYLHTHPVRNHMHSSAPALIKKVLANGGHPDEPTDQISFHLIFPEAGIYKLFAQFRPEGIELPADESLVAEFYVQIEEQKPLFSPWWINLLWSVIAMTILIWGVKKYIKVPPQITK